MANMIVLADNNGPAKDYMSEQIDRIKIDAEKTDGDMYLALQASAISPELKLALQRGRATIKEFLDYDFPAIEEAAK
jgi:hypothetical protein